MDEKFTKLKLKASEKGGSRFIFYCLYSGHGCLENTTKIILPEAGKYFSLEKVL